MNTSCSPLQVFGNTNKAFDAFEVDWREGRRPRIEDVLGGPPVPDRAMALRLLIAAELEARLGHGERPSVDEYLERFPTDSEAVRNAFADTERESVSTDPDPSLSHHPRPELPSTDLQGEFSGSDLTVSFSYDHPGAPARTPESAGPRIATGPESLPESIGRFRPTRFLGEGGFGKVYHAWDERLGRPVAIKVARATTPGGRDRRESLLHEARMAAQLDHPAIVTVFEFGRTAADEPFVVLKYIEGTTLSHILHRKKRLPHDRLCRLVARVAEAAHHAHKKEIVHRDLTPANILIDRDGEPFITDFGLAVSEDLQNARPGEVAGKTGYMAPEQVRGETNHLDGRTDIWAMGIILYQGLTGRLPFVADTRQGIFDAILDRDPKPPRQTDEKIPPDLDRICLRCLAKQKTDRYSSAIALAEDLRAWLGQADAAPGHVVAAPVLATIPVVPKGLRAFDADDAEFFLDLLPGPRDRHGMAESVRFWRAKVGARESTAVPAFGVGLLYGPSGGGKTSFVRAALLPMLGDGVRVFYLEATPDRTEAQLLAALRRELPELPEELGLVETAALLRDTPSVRGGNKVLIVLDQFEQWLHAHPSDPSAELVRALRHCDGRGLQTLVLARDDFWMAVTRFFRAIDTPLIEMGNMAAVELFDADHARSVLVKFGRAYGRLPAEPEAPGAEARAFLDEAVAEMAGSEGRVAPVRLSLFAEVVRRRPWTPETLKTLGGMDGIGVTFLDQAFGTGDRSAPPPYRAHRKAIEGVLQALLPAPSSDLKGKTQPVSILREAAGYDQRPGEFAEVLRILDHELRMMTPVDAEQAPEADATSTVEPAASSERAYQLTHDFLVPSLRDWLTREQRATREGRARLRLATATAFWREKPGPRRLPSVLEWMFILWNAPRSMRLPDERTMLAAATRRYVGRASAAIAAVVLVGWAVMEVRRNDEASSLLKQAMHADARRFPDLLPLLSPHRDRIRASLAFIERDAPRNTLIGDGDAPNRLDPRRATLILFHHEPTLERAEVLLAQLPTAMPDDLALVREALAAHPRFADTPMLRKSVLDENAEPSTRLRHAAALARLDPGTVPEWKPAAVSLTKALLAEDRRLFARWLELLEPALLVFSTTLQDVCQNPAPGGPDRAAAAEALALVLGRQGDHVALARAVVATPRPASRPLLRQLRRVRFADGSPTTTILRDILNERPDDLDDAERTRLADRQASAAVALAALGNTEVLWPRLRHRDDPRLRTRLIEALASTDDAPRWVFARLARPIKELDPVERQALLMVLAETDFEGLLANLQDEGGKLARTSYRDDPDSGVHSAAALVLDRWRRAELRARADAEIREKASGKPPAFAHRSWIEGPNGHTLAVMRGPLKFWIGSPDTEAERYDCEALQYRRIDRSVAVSTTEVTVGQFREYERKYQPETRYAREPNCPAIAIKWTDAIGYCNWLSKQAKIPEGQWCYPEEIKDGARIEAGDLNKTGYRLLTEAEWEFFCRAGCRTSRPFDESDEFLSRHAWTWLNSNDRTHPVGSLLPNEFGLFDMLGNVWEWCQDGPADVNTGVYQDPYPKGTPDAPSPDVVPTVAKFGPEVWRYLRGGAYEFSPNKARSATRDEADAPSHRPFNGFRVARTVPADAK